MYCMVRPKCPDDTHLHLQLLLTSHQSSDSQATNGTHHAPETSDFVPGEFSIDEYRPMRIVVVGAGFSGIVAGIRFCQKIPNLDLTIYEKNTGVGGTWYSNKYPGAACDIPAHRYQLTFEMKTNWSSFYASGPEILQYLEGVVEKYKLGPYLKLQHQLVHARYDEPTDKWLLRIRKTVYASNGEHTEEFDDAADFLFTGVGLISRWSWPEIEGLKSFGGKMFHSADFDTGEQTWREAAESWGDKRVAVIGVGSSAIRLVPALQDKVAHLTGYVRGKTWLSMPFSGSKITELVNRSSL
ncbi:FAD/NAD(P)-binding domain-containing protein [Obba rivulosa]|uniref:FAD/NAD(P)-binding domain-containing protein n=1 Tax=Obba rivulosa TaxID=1052685 RepID=A0A8E2AUA4_9APHY|nr:FAD/NAD(P)-binding domain-containing protein [Obba rivulosa]